jgi:arylsulfatase A-like enzyme
MPAPPLGDWVDLYNEYANPYDPAGHVGKVDPHVLQRARAGYYGHMTHIDHQIYRFIEAMRQYNVFDNTYFLFTADHGEMMGDHHMFRKGYAYEGAARVPFILAGPRDSGIVHGSAYDQVVELRDVMPTLLSCAGLPVPENVGGFSVLPLARGGEPAWREYIHGEHTVFGQSMQWLTDGHEKYIWLSGSGHEQLFDLDADPQELHDLARDPGASERVARWRQTLITELAGREEGFTDGLQLIAGRPVKPVLSHP